jgi:hypothetical protein
MFEGLGNWGIIALICGIVGLPIAGIIEDRKGFPSIGAIVAGMGIVFLAFLALRLVMMEIGII